MSISDLALLIGLGARILLDQFTRSAESSIRESLVLGLWQGCGLHYVTATNQDLLVPAAVVAGAKLLFDLVAGQEALRTIVTIIGIPVGYCVADLASRWMDSSEYGRQHRKRHLHHSHRQQRERSRSRHTRSEGDERRSPRRDNLRRAVSDITSVDSNSLLFGRDPTMTPLDREVAALRARASLADSERRRYKEEKKWAIEAGNAARAKEMSWQVKRYSALMKSFHREADDKIIAASNGSRREQHYDDPSQTRRHHTPDSRDEDRRRSMRVSVR
ncbi:hypothetical protein FB45DRAFT_892451 [Roridomyces roridus]|uniref:Uncharacterized protein n=1 Tax=Roridomyces roridus TaxID=1738132 RepID=A0AAD7FZ32_9AGAR|nr:hypothetical protein FB45DRAFT_892451 [Roridomyces roridus]